MTGEKENRNQIVGAFHSKREVVEDPAFEIGLSDHLRTAYGTEALVELYGRFANGDGRLML
jgi:galactoside O-acetyltransferase